MISRACYATFMRGSSARLRRVANGVVEYAQRVDGALRAMLPGTVVGTYLHGSGAFGDFVPGWSDVDLLFVIEDDPPPRSAEEIARQLAVAAVPCPGVGMEASVVTRAQAQADDGSWRFVVHLATAPAGRKTVSGVGHPGDPDLLMHFAVACAAGIAISGPPPSTVLRAPSRQAVLGYLVDELDDALEGPCAYAVLNACRAWRYVDTGDLVSKITGGTWALPIGPTKLVQRALDEQRGLLQRTMLDAAGARFVEGVRDRIVAAIAPSG